MIRTRRATAIVVFLLLDSTRVVQASQRIDPPPCSPLTRTDVADVTTKWGGDLNRPIRWGRETLRIDVELLSTSSTSTLCDWDAWVEIWQTSPIRRRVDVGGVSIVSGKHGDVVHRFEWRIAGRTENLPSGVYEILFSTGAPRNVGNVGDEKLVAGFTPISWRRSVVKPLLPDKGSIRFLGAPIVAEPDVTVVTVGRR